MFVIFRPLLRTQCHQQRKNRIASLSKYCLSNQWIQYRSQLFPVVVAPMDLHIKHKSPYQKSQLALHLAPIQPSHHPHRWWKWLSKPLWAPFKRRCLNSLDSRQSIVHIKQETLSHTYTQTPTQKWENHSLFHWNKQINKINENHR